MSNKKSYMNLKNLLSENFFKKLKDYIKFLNKHGKNLSPKEKKLLANPSLRKSFKKFLKHSDKLDKDLKKYGMK